MSSINKRFYKNRVALNILANSPENAKVVFEAAEGFAIIGVLSKNYPTTAKAVRAMEIYGELIDGAVSIGLGGGDNRQASVVADIAKHYAGNHINQVFPAVGATRANLGDKESFINSLVSPTGHVGFVNISTGPHSASLDQKAHIPIESAIALIRDMGGNSIKFFPMNGLGTIDEFRAVAIACGKENFALEPTGGIDLANFETILEIALEANVPQIIPHIYSSIIDSETGKTNPDDVEKLITITKRLADDYG